MLPAHRRRKLRREQAGPLLALVVGERVDVGDDRHLGVAWIGVGDRAAQRHPRRDHVRGVERARHRQRHDLLGAELASVVGCRGDSGGRAGDHHLPGRVVVGDPDVLVGAPAGHVDLVVVEPEDGGHRAGLGEPGLVHRLGAGAHEADAFVEPEGAGGGQRGVLAEAVAGAEAGLEAEPFDGVEHHQARHERRQLGVAGVAKLVGVGVGEQLADVTVGDLAGLLDELPALVIDPRSSHPRPLRPLAGEGEREHPLKGRRWHGAPLGLPTGNEEVTGTLAQASPGSPTGRRRWLQNPYSVGSNPTRGTTRAVSSSVRRTRPAARRCVGGRRRSSRHSSDGSAHRGRHTPV